MSATQQQEEQEQEELDLLVVLPNELKVHIFDLLDWPHLARTSLVSRSWHRVSLAVWQLRWQASARPFLGAEARLPLLVCHQNTRLADLDAERWYSQCVHKLANKDVVSLKVVLVGDTGVGKTTLLNRLVTMGQHEQRGEDEEEEEDKKIIPSTFSNFTIPALYQPVEEAKPTTAPELVFVSLWDTEMWDTSHHHSYNYFQFVEAREKKRLKKVEAESASAGEDYTRMRRLTYPWTDIFLLCFAINNKQSLTNLTTNWKEELDKWAPPHHVRVLCGLHADARDDKAEARNCVNTYAIFKAQEELAATAYIEVSSSRVNSTAAAAQQVVEQCIDEMYRQCFSPSLYETFDEWNSIDVLIYSSPTEADYAPVANKPFRYFNTTDKVEWYCGSFEVDN